MWYAYEKDETQRRCMAAFTPSYHKVLFVLKIVMETWPKKDGRRKPVDLTLQYLWITIIYDFINFNYKKQVFISDHRHQAWFTIKLIFRKNFRRLWRLAWTSSKFSDRCVEMWEIPIFFAKKLNNIFSLMNNCGQNLRKYFRLYYLREKIGVLIFWSD